MTLDPRTMTEMTALIESGSAEMGVSLPPESVEALARFLGLMRKWNRGQNLTAVTDPAEMVAKHVLDSLAGLPWVRGERVLDVGSGAGLPGIPLAIARPSWRVVLLDSRGKRIQFLRYVKQALALDNVEIVEARFEKYPPERKFDTLTVRAFAAFPELARGAEPFITAGARLVVWKGSDPTVEMEATLAHQPVRYAVHALRVPGVDASRHIAVVESAG